MNFFIDMGNSRLKWASGCNQDDLTAGEPLLNSSLTTDALTRLWQDIEAPAKVAISQVSADGLSEIVHSVICKLWPDTQVIFAKSQAFACGVTNAYSQPEKLGVDRWLGMIACYDQYKNGFCLADCGTAITLDIVNSSGKHLGGLISPGLFLMKQSLALGTERLELTTEIYPSGLANHTEAAIYNGTLAAACGLIELTHKAYNELPLIITGEDAQAIAAALSIPVMIDPDLVLRGLALASMSTL